MATTTEVPTDAPAAGRAFWRFWTASTVSNVGTAVTTVALPLVAVTVLHAGSFGVSTITAASYVAWVVIGLPAGVLVHRLPVRGVQVAMDLLRAVALLAVPVLALAHQLRLWQLLAVAVVVGLADVVFDVGNSTFLASVVPKGELTRRNSFTQGTFSVTQTGGPGLGGVLVQLAGAPGAIFVDIASYLASAWLLCGLARPAGVHAQQRGAPVLPAIRDGWRYVRHHPVVGPGALTASACNFACGGFLALTPVFLIRTTHASSALVGVLIATEGAGALIGAALCPRLSTRLGSGHTLLLVSVVGSAASLLMPMATHGWGWLLFAAGNAGFAGATVILSILLRAHRQETVPPALLSRVMATVRFVSWGQIPLGALLAGAIAAATSPRTSLWVFAGLTVLEPTIVWTSRIGRFRELSEAGRGLGRLGTLRP